MITGNKNIVERDHLEDKKQKNEFLDWIVHIVAAVIAGVLIVTFVGQRTIVYDISMQPTLVEGDNLLVEKLGHKFGWLNRGDIIIIKIPESDKPLIKRLIALEGDRVEVKEGKVYVNDELSLIGLESEPMTPYGNEPGFTDLTVPEGFIYVLGDNREHSIDSTEFGPINKDYIKGRAVFRFYPFSKFGTLK